MQPLKNYLIFVSGEFLQLYRHTQWNGYQSRTDPDFIWFVIAMFVEHLCPCHMVERVTFSRELLNKIGFQKLID